MTTTRVEPTSADPRTVMQHKTATEQRASAVPKVVLVFHGHGQHTELSSDPQRDVACLHVPPNSAAQRPAPHRRAPWRQRRPLDQVCPPNVARHYYDGGCDFSVRLLCAAGTAVSVWSAGHGMYTATPYVAMTERVLTANDDFDRELTLQRSITDALRDTSRDTLIVMAGPRHHE